MTIVYCLNISDIHQEDLCLQALPPERKRRMQSAVRPKKAKQLAMAWFLLRYALRQTDQHIHFEQDFVVNQYGKPELPGCPVWFNLSHSDDYVACIVSDTAPVGVDIQKSKKMPASVLNGFFSQRDCEAISCLSDDLAWCELWTRKEALLKCTGQGWGHPKAKEIDIADEEITLDGKRYCIKCRKIQKDYTVSGCTQTFEDEIVFCEVTNDEIKSFIIC